MAPSCAACSSSATFYCAQDASWLCESCDSMAHRGPLTMSHSRVPACAVCVERPAAHFCRNDGAYLCDSCNTQCHEGLPLKHNIIPAAQALKEGIAPSCVAAAAAAPAAPCAEHSACGESSPCDGSSPVAASAAPAAPPAAAAARPRRVSEDSAQRVPEFDAAVVPPALDCELPKGQPMDKAALAKSIWGKDLDALELDNTWLDRLDMGFDLGDDVLAELVAADGLVPTTSDSPRAIEVPGLPPSPTAAAAAQPLTLAGAAKAAGVAGGAGAAVVPKQEQLGLGLAALERQTTDEFFAALAADDFAVPSLSPTAPPAAPQAPAAVVPQAVVPQAVVVPQAPAQMVYLAPQPMMPLVPQPAPFAVPQHFMPAGVPVAAPAPQPRAAPSQQAPAPKRQRRAAAAAALRGDDSDDDFAAAAADDSDEEWRADGHSSAAPSRGGASALARAASAPAAAQGLIVVDGLTREQRVARYREKRKNRQFRKTIRYASRKAYAEVRPRIKGRFAKREELEAWRTAERAMAAGAAAAGVVGAASGEAAASLACAFGGADAAGLVPIMA